MKLWGNTCAVCLRYVAPFTGAWIETQRPAGIVSRAPVAPFTGAWIETIGGSVYMGPDGVAPFTGAWIETQEKEGNENHNSSRTLHGCVD